MQMLIRTKIAHSLGVSYKVVLLCEAVSPEDIQISLGVRKFRGHSDKTLG